MADNQEHTPPNNDLALIPATVNRFSNVGDINQLIEYVTPFVKGSLCPFQEPADAALAYIWAMDKGISPIEAFNHLVIVNGRVGADSFLTRAMLQKGGIFASVVITHGEPEDFRPLYTYTYRSDTYDQDMYDANRDQYAVFLSADSLKAAHDKGNIPAGKIPVVRSAQPYDYRTRLMFRRFIGKTVLQEVGEFTWSRAQAAGLTEKSNWKNYPRECQYARAYMTGARRIGADKMAETYSKEELYTEHDIELDATEFEVMD